MNLTYRGYLGIILANICKSAGGNIIASIVGFILMGQTLIVVGSYLKRLFMCIFLGIVSPMIVAADTIMSSMGNQPTIFKNWIRNFSLTVFMQTVHALYMVVTLQIIAGVYNSGPLSPEGNGLNESQAAIVVIILTTGLVKLEKLIKALFGIGDSFAGDLKSGAKGMVQAMGAVRGITAGAKALSNNVPKMKDAAKRKQAYSKQLDELKSQKQTSNNRYMQAISAARDAKHRGDTAEYNKQMKIAMQARRESVFGKGASSVQKGTSSADSAKNVDVVKQAIDKQSSVSAQNNITLGEQIRKAEEGYAQAHADLKSATLATIMGPANLAAGIGIGIGVEDQIGEALFKGGHITAALDKGAEIVGYVSADKDRKSLYRNEAADGQTIGYTPSDKLIREKTTKNNKTKRKRNA